MVRLAFFPSVTASLREFRVTARYEQFERQFERAVSRRFVITSYWFCCVIVLGRLLRWSGAVLVCRLKGHDLDTHSSIGPESGIEYFECRRCGASWHHIYY